MDRAAGLGDRCHSLQKGEVDWVEQPLIDLCPMLRTARMWWSP
jgi:hypothetical protein